MLYAQLLLCCLTVVSSDKINSNEGEGNSESVKKPEVRKIYIPLLFRGLKNKCSQEQKVVDCSYIMKYKKASGVDYIATGKRVKVYCDMTTDGGGWTVIKKRTTDTSLNFNNTLRLWTEYERGFGDVVNGDYWLGNQLIHQLTSSATYILRIELWYKSNNHFYVNYKTFVVRDSESKYKLTIGRYRTDEEDGVKDSLGPNNGMKFSTIDQDNDLSNENCAVRHGGWWLKDCSTSVLNSELGILWDDDHDFEKSVMMIREYTELTPGVIKSPEWYSVHDAKNSIFVSGKLIGDTGMSRTFTTTVWTVQNCTCYTAMVPMKMIRYKKNPPFCITVSAVARDVDNLLI